MSPLKGKTEPWVKKRIQAPAHFHHRVLVSMQTDKPSLTGVSPLADQHPRFWSTCRVRHNIQRLLFIKHTNPHPCRGTFIRRSTRSSRWPRWTCQRRRAADQKLQRLTLRASVGDAKQRDAIGCRHGYLGDGVVSIGRRTCHIVGCVIDLVGSIVTRQRPTVCPSSVRMGSHIHLDEANTGRQSKYGK